LAETFVYTQTHCILQFCCCCLFECFFYTC